MSLAMIPKPSLGEKRIFGGIHTKNYQMLLEETPDIALPFYGRDSNSV